jgi:hypothetical protein
MQRLASASQFSFLRIAANRALPQTGFLVNKNSYLTIFEATHGPMSTAPRLIYAPYE